MKIIIYAFSDPLCTWCWGSELLLRKIAWRYRDHVEIKYVMGGMVKDVLEMNPNLENNPETMDAINKAMGKSWERASERHQMPVNGSVMKLFSPEYRSSFPQNKAFLVAKLQDERKADRFLRRIREATAVEGKQTNVPDVMATLATEVDLDAGQLLEDLQSEKARELFEENIYFARNSDVDRLPSYLITYGREEILLSGGQEYQLFKSIILGMSGGKYVEEYRPSYDEVVEYVNHFITFAPVEIKEVFDFNEAEAKEMIDKLLDEGKVEPFPNEDSPLYQKK